MIRKRPSGKETIGYAERVSESIVVCGTKEKGGKQERMENMEAKNLPNGRTLRTTIVSLIPSWYVASVVFLLSRLQNSLACSVYFPSRFQCVFRLLFPFLYLSSIPLSVDVYFH